MAWNREQELIDTAMPSSESNGCFIDAVKSLLDECDTDTLGVLADRLTPFQIDFKEVFYGDTISIKPVLVLENGQSPKFDMMQSACRGLLSSGPTASSNGWSDNMSTTGNGSAVSSTDTCRNTQLMDMLPWATTSHVVPGSTNSILLEEAISETSDRNATPVSVDMSEAGDSSPGNSNTQRASGDSAICTTSCSDTLDFSFLNSPNVFCSATIESVQISHGEDSVGQPAHDTFGNGHPDSLDLCSTTFSTPSSGAEVHRISSVAMGGISPDGRTSRMDSRQVVPPTQHPVVPDSEQAAVCRRMNKFKKRRGGAEKMELVATNMPKVALAVSTCIRPDYIQFLELNLPHWCRDGLWRNTLAQDTPTGFHRYNKLQKAYICVCRLDKRMGDDLIRSRMAMIFVHLEYEKAYGDWKALTQHRAGTITGVGRGRASSMIDTILANTHPEWGTCSAQQQADLRAKFHDGKRYGKRWWILVNLLGPGILVLSSSRLAGTMNTTVTSSMLKTVARRIQLYEQDVMRVISLVNPIAESLLRDDGYDSHDTKQILDKLRLIGLSTGGGKQQN